MGFHGDADEHLYCRLTRRIPSTGPGFAERLTGVRPKIRRKSVDAWHTHTHTHTLIYAHVLSHPHVCTCLYTWAHVHTPTHIHACLHVFVHTCPCLLVCMIIHVRAQIYTCVPTHTLTYARMYTLTQTHPHSHTHPFILTLFVHSRTHLHIPLNHTTLSKARQVCGPLANITTRWGPDARMPGVCLANFTTSQSGMEHKVQLSTSL